VLTILTLCPAYLKDRFLVFLAMGNISNLWYLNSQGGSWCETKCELDAAFKMPYVNRETRYLFAYVPINGEIKEIWITKEDGTRVHDIIAEGGQWKVIVYEDGSSYVAFKMPALGDLACPQIPSGETVCVISLNEYFRDQSLTVQGWWADFKNGVNNMEFVITYNGGATYALPEIPPEWTVYGDPALWSYIIPCPAPGDENINFTFEAFSNGASLGGGSLINVSYVTDEPVMETLNCFHVEIPLFLGDTEIDVLKSEPFECGGCDPSVVISSDYCRNQTDIFGQQLFFYENQGESQYGNLGAATNNFRIPAVLTQKPSKKEVSRNLRCNTFSKSIVQQYKLQGANTDFPQYMVNIIESILGGKNFFIDGEEYIDVSEEDFQERNVPGRSMRRLEMSFEKCRKRIVFDCSCEPEPVNCEDNPVTGFVLIVAAPDADGVSAVNRVYEYAEIIGLSGGVPPYVIDNWSSPQGTPNSDVIPFDDSREYNIFKRTDYGEGSMTVTVTVKDSRGCQYDLGNSVLVDDLTCVEDIGNFGISVTGGGNVSIDSVAPAGLVYEYSFDNSSWMSTGGTISPASFALVLTPSTEYTIYIRTVCDGGYGHIGGLTFTTLP